MFAVHARTKRMAGIRKIARWEVRPPPYWAAP